MFFGNLPHRVWNLCAPSRNPFRDASEVNVFQRNDLRLIQNSTSRTRLTQKKLQGPEMAVIGYYLRAELFAEPFQVA